MRPGFGRRLKSLWGERDITLRLISLVIAFAVWVLATGPERGPAVREETVPLQVQGLPGDWQVVDAPESVRVRFESPPLFLRRWQGEIVARVEVETPAVGVQRLPVQVAAPGEVRLLSVNPTHVLVDLDRVTSREAPLSVSLLGQPPAGFWVGSVRLDPQKVRLNGLSRRLAQVVAVVAQIRLADFSPPAEGGEVTAAVPVAPLDAGGAVLPGVQASPGEVQATVNFRIPGQPPAGGGEGRSQSMGEPGHPEGPPGSPTA